MVLAALVGEGGLRRRRDADDGLDAYAIDDGALGPLEDGGGLLVEDEPETFGRLGGGHAVLSTVLNFVRSLVVVDCFCLYSLGSRGGGGGRTHMRWGQKEFGNVRLVGLVRLGRFKLLRSLRSQWLICVFSCAHEQLGYARKHFREHGQEDSNTHKDPAVGSTDLE